MTDNTGNQIGTTVKYLPFGETRATVTVPTDKLFTGQRPDGTGLYYYNARYYDPTIGRFISPDTIIQSMANPQCFNRYSYCLNNPLKYTDPSGFNVKIGGIDVEDPSCMDASIILQMTPEQQKEFFAALQAWLAARETAPTDTQKLMDSDTTYTVQLGDINPNLDSIYDSKTNTITINGNYLEDASWWTGRSLLPAIYDASYTISPNKLSQFFITMAEVTPKILWYPVVVITTGAGAVLFITGLVTFNPLMAYGGYIIGANGYNGLALWVYNATNGQWNWPTIPGVPKP
jgi:RHS repeat-associated protein